MTKNINIFSIPPSSFICLLTILVSLAEGKGLLNLKETCVPQGNCIAPDCLCPNIEHPNSANLPLADVPQIVHLTFDAGVTIQNYPLYEKIFDERVNPNGAPISGTFFVSHDYNNYSLTNSLWRKGHEIGLHSISHKSESEYWKNLDEAGWRAEVTDQIGQMAKFAKIPAEEIVGFRAPFIQGGGDIMYGVLANDFQYESSRPTWRYRPILWPYTADYDSFQDCQIPPCPIKSYPGFWVSPLVDLLGSNGSPCATVDTCLDIPTNKEEAYELLMRNFNDHYNGNKAPFGVHANAAWLQNIDRPYILQGYLEFLDHILEMEDVFIVSIHRGLDWMQNPVGIGDVDQISSWVAPPNPPPNNCQFNFNCFFTGDQLPPGMSGERIMNSCVLCPGKFPWIGNPLGL